MLALINLIESSETSLRIVTSKLQIIIGGGGGGFFHWKIAFYCIYCIKLLVFLQHFNNQTGFSIELYQINAYYGIKLDICKWKLNVVSTLTVVNNKCVTNIPTQQQQKSSLLWTHGNLVISLTFSVNFLVNASFDVAGFISVRMFLIWPFLIMHLIWCWHIINILAVSALWTF